MGAGKSAEAENIGGHAQVWPMSVHAVQLVTSCEFNVNFNFMTVLIRVEEMGSSVMFLRSSRTFLLYLSCGPIICIGPFWLTDLLFCISEEKTHLLFRYYEARGSEFNRVIN